MVGYHPVYQDPLLSDQMQMRCATLPLIAACLISSGSVSGEIIASIHVRDTALGSVKEPVLRKHQGMLVITAQNIFLGELLQALNCKSPVKIKLAEPSLAACPLSAKHVQAASLREAIEKLLEGFSYTLYSSASGVLAVHVLASCPPAPGSQLNTVKDAPIQEDEEMLADGEPRTLDDFEPLSVPEPSGDGEEDGEFAFRSGEQEAQERAHREAVVNRALKAIDSPHRHLKSEAVNSLAGIQEAEAIQALSNAASGKLDLTMETRAKAVAALWHSASESEPPNPTAVSALEELAQDLEPQVNSVARNALKDLRLRALVSASPEP